VGYDISPIYSTENWKGLAQIAIWIFECPAFIGIPVLGYLIGGFISYILNGLADELEEYLESRK